MVQRRKHPSGSASRPQAAKDYEKLLDGLPVGIERIDTSGSILYSNPAHHELFRYRPGELIGKSIFDLMAEPEQAQELRRYLEQLIRDQPPPEPWEGLNRRQDGSTFEAHVDWRYEHGELGELVGFVAAVTDITPQRQAERERDRGLLELEEGQRHLTSLMESAVGFVLYRLAAVPAKPFSGEVVFVSPSIRDVMGVEKPEDFSTWFADILPEDRDRVVEANRRSSETGIAFDEEMRIRHPKTGEIRWLRAISRPIFDDAGVPRFFNGLILDVTAQRRADEERKRFERKLQQGQRLESLGTLAGGIAHDFNNLLFGILGNAELALRLLPEGAAARPHVEDARAAAKRAADLTHQLLAYSGRGSFRVEETRLNALLREMSRVLATVVPKTTTIELELDEALPPVKADVSQLQQVVMNLITNASDALEGRPGVATVETSTVDLRDVDLGRLDAAADLAPGRYVRLVVSDNGGGMVPEILERLFDPFFTTKESGRGLGLAAVRGIVHGHLGAIDVDSTVGAGSRFSIYLPATEAAAERPVAAAARPAAAAGEPKRVLVIDDEDLVRSLARRLLERAGHQVTTARDGVEGLRCARDDDFDVVVLDMSMPKMTGSETFRRLRQIRPDLRVVFSSGYPEEESAELLEAAENVAFVQKPYRAVELLAKLSDAARTPS